MAPKRMSSSAPPQSSGDSPARSGLVIAALICVATVANLNLSVANVALPEIAIHFEASQIGINLVAVGYSLGLAASVLWFGAVGDRYGRRNMLLIGTTLAIPASVVAAWAPSVRSGPSRSNARRCRPTPWVSTGRCLGD